MKFATIVTVFVSSGLTNAYRSVLSARGGDLGRRFGVRAHRAGRQRREGRLGLVDGELAELLLFVGAEATEDGVDLGQDHEPVDAELTGEEGGGAVLVDYGVEAGEADAATHGRDAAAAAGDDDRPGGDQRADRLELDHLQRLRGRDDPAPAAARVVHDLPAALALQLTRLRLVVERPDRLGRLLESGIVLGDEQ